MSESRAGWYPDPSGDPSKLRYWDGSQWTDDYADSPSSAPGTGQGAQSCDETVYEAPIIAGFHAASHRLRILRHLHRDGGLDAHSACLDGPDDGVRLGNLQGPQAQHDGLRCVHAHLCEPRGWHPAPRFQEGRLARNAPSCVTKWGQTPHSAQTLFSSAYSGCVRHAVASHSALMTLRGHESGSGFTS